MNHPYLFVAGCFIFGYLLPELIVAFAKVKVPLLFNLYSALASALIAASFVI